MQEVAPLQPGEPEELSGYRLEGRLGEGGQGVVYLGRDHAGRYAAVKVLHARLAQDADARRRFLREIAAAKQVAGFGTAQVLDADASGERPFVASEYVDGPSLQELVSEEGPRSGGALERLAVGTAMALSSIHRAGLVHRDFKPAHVLLGPDGPRVIDFGIARVLDGTATLTAGVIGTPSYMAPEQLGRGTISAATDVFSWACTMVYAATGAPPFGDDTVAAVMTRILTAEPDLTGVPSPLAGIVAACLAKDHGARPGIRQVLDRLLGELGAAGELGALGALGAAENENATGPAAATGPAPYPPAATTGGTGGTSIRSAVASAPDAATVTHLPSPPGPVPPPPVALPTMPDAAPPPPAGAAPKGRTWQRRWALPVGSAAALVVLAGVGVWWLGGDQDGTPPSSASSAQAGSGPRKFTGLTRKGCRMVSAATVARLVPEAEADPRGQGPDHEAYYDEASCVWKHDIDDPSIMRKLVVDVNVQLEADDVHLPQDQPVDPVQRVEAAMDKVRREDQQVANRTRRLPWGDTAYYGSLAEPSGIGDAAVEFSEHVRSEDGLLDPETVTITARLANAEISVQYSSGESRGTLMSPTPEPTVRELAEVVARELVDGLKKCAECVR